MPKVCLTQKQREEERLRKDNERLHKNLELIEGGRSSREMGAIIGMSAASYCKRRKSPEILTYEEIRKLCRNRGVSVASFCDGKLKLAGLEAGA